MAYDRIIMSAADPFPTIHKLAQEINEFWPAYEIAAEKTGNAEELLRDALTEAAQDNRLLDSDASLVLFGSFARFEMVEGSDYDWALLVDGVVRNDHADLGRRIAAALQKRNLKSPGATGTFGNLVFSHDLVHQIGGGADSNANLTRRMLMLLESRPISLSAADSSSPVWENVLGNILQRYFEEDVHFAPVGDHKVPRFLLNDLTRYWRTIGVDYAAKHREQHGQKWAIRNAKLRFSRKLLYASGLAFCLSCQLDPPDAVHDTLFGSIRDKSAAPFVAKATAFSRTPALEYLAAFVDAFITDAEQRRLISTRVFGAYNSWLELLGNEASRQDLEGLSHADAGESSTFQHVRDSGFEFATGLEMLFFGRDRDQEENRIAKLSLEYVGF